jgi:hypothetical protein
MVCLSQLKITFLLYIRFYTKVIGSLLCFFFGNKTISSEVGVQQGDSCGPMSFSITVQPLVNNLLPKLNI